MLPVGPDAQCDGTERLAGERQEGADLAAVGGKGARGASVQPERHQVGIAVGLLRGGCCRYDRRGHNRRLHCPSRLPPRPCPNSLPSASQMP